MGFLGFILKIGTFPRALNNQCWIRVDGHTAFYETYELLIPVLKAIDFIHQFEILLELPFD